MITLYLGSGTQMLSHAASRSVFFNSMNGPLSCGGLLPDKTPVMSCSMLQGGSWVSTHTLKFSRVRHCSWRTRFGVILMGGINSPRTTEIVGVGGMDMQLWALKYDIV